MIIYDLKTMQRCEIKEDTVVALGTFDGCHKGHAAVLRGAFYLAKKIGAKSVAYTFDTVPRGDKVIFTLDEKIKAIARFGIDYIAIDSFDRVRDMDAKSFVQKILFDELRAKGASCGYNYRFGHCAAASAEDLKGMLENVGGSVRISPEISVGGETICSTLIRNKIENGEIEDIIEYSHPYSIYAPVEKGKGLGKKMGVATINQRVPSGKVQPCVGVYITDCSIGEDVYPSVTNVGYRPTTDGENEFLNVETHIIGYEGNLYESCLRVTFFKYLREEIRFSSIEELTEQINEDVLSAKRYFGYPV